MIVIGMLVLGCPGGDITLPGINQDPEANAGVDRNIDVGQRVTLNGLGSIDADDDALSFGWQQISGPPVALNNSLSAGPSFTPVQDGVYEFLLTVTDGRGGTDAAVVRIFVGVEPVEGAPTASAGPDQTVSEGAAVTLRGGASSDPDGDVLSFEWQQLSGATVSLGNPFVTSPSFTAPQTDGDTVLVFQLTVRDQSGLSGTDSVVITVRDLDGMGPSGPETMPETQIERIYEINDPDTPLVVLAVSSAGDSVGVIAAKDEDGNPIQVLGGIYTLADGSSISVLLDTQGRPGVMIVHDLVFTFSDYVGNTTLLTLTGNGDSRSERVDLSDVADDLLELQRIVAGGLPKTGTKTRVMAQTSAGPDALSVGLRAAGLAANTTVCSMGVASAVAVTAGTAGALTPVGAIIAGAACGSAVVEVVRLTSGEKSSSDLTLVDIVLCPTDVVNCVQAVAGIVVAFREAEEKLEQVPQEEKVDLLKDQPFPSAENCDPGFVFDESSGICIPDRDSDGDGTSDRDDGCPNDPQKIEPGECGCRKPDTDTDRDGTLDCNDNCPMDKEKIEPGACGCGVGDTDDDGTEDCNDNCPMDKEKIEPGECGCGEIDRPDCEDDSNPLCDSLDQQSEAAFARGDYCEGIQVIIRQIDERCPNWDGVDPQAFLTALADECP